MNICPPNCVEDGVRAGSKYTAGHDLRRFMALRGESVIACSPPPSSTPWTTTDKFIHIRGIRCALESSFFDLVCANELSQSHDQVKTPPANPLRIIGTKWKLYRRQCSFSFHTRHFRTTFGLEIFNCQEAEMSV